MRVEWRLKPSTISLQHPSTWQTPRVYNTSGRSLPGIANIYLQLRLDGGATGRSGLFVYPDTESQVTFKVGFELLNARGAKLIVDHATHTTLQYSVATRNYGWGTWHATKSVMEAAEIVVSLELVLG